jgi:transposase
VTVLKRFACSADVRRIQRRSMETTYNIAGIDVHKSMVAVVITDAAREGEFQFERRKFGATESELRQLAAWLAGHEVREAVMESTAQYWRLVWQQLEGQCAVSGAGILQSSAAGP